MLGNNSTDNILKFSYFFQKIGFEIVNIQTVSLEDNLHEMTKLIFWENKHAI